MDALETDRLRLLPPDPVFVPDVFAYGRDAEFCRFIDASPMTTEQDACNFLASLTKDNASGHRMYWVATRKSDGRAVGTLGLIFPFAARHRTAEFGYGFAPEVWKSGLFQEASRAVIAQAFDILDFVRLQAITRATNIKAIRSVEKLGFVREATLRSFYQVGDTRDDAALLALTER